MGPRRYRSPHGDRRSHGPRGARTSRRARRRPPVGARAVGDRVVHSTDPIRNSYPAAGDASRRQFAGQFYDQTYLAKLRPLCLEIIDRLGPITFAHLAERVARAHGFQRTGSEIKKRVWSAVGRQRKATRAPNGTSTLWPLGQEPTPLVAYRGEVVAGEPRPWVFVPYVERLGLAADVVGTTPAELRLTELARRLGVGRLRAKTRDELVELLESAAGMRGD